MGHLMIYHLPLVHEPGLHLVHFSSAETLSLCERMGKEFVVESFKSQASAQADPVEFNATYEHSSQLC